MTEDKEVIKKRFLELDRKAYAGGYYTFTDFLGLAEQSLFSEVASRISSKYTRFGGDTGTERIMIRFGDPDEVGYELPFPIVCIKAEPVSQKFADKLSHRDFLGALMNLGIERDMLGDIAIHENIGYIFAKENIAEFILSELTRVKKTDVKLSITSDIPSGELYRTEKKRIQANGERLDAIISKVYCISREDSLSLFRRKLVYVDGRLMENNSYIAKIGETVSVRGYGRMIYRGYESKSRKGKLNIDIEVYI